MFSLVIYFIHSINSVMCVNPCLPIPLTTTPRPHSPDQISWCLKKTGFWNVVNGVHKQTQKMHKHSTRTTEWKGCYFIAYAKVTWKKDITYSEIQQAPKVPISTGCLWDSDSTWWLCFHGVLLHTLTSPQAIHSNWKFYLFLGHPLLCICHQL